MVIYLPALLAIPPTAEINLNVEKDPEVGWISVRGCVR